VAELKHGTVQRFSLAPERFGMQRAPFEALVVKNAQESLAAMRAVLADTPGPVRDIVLLNAGAAIYVAGIVDTLEQGVEKAREVISSGAARKKLEDMATLTNEFT